TFVPSSDAADALKSVVSAINSHFGVSLGSVIDSFKIVLQKTSLGYKTVRSDASGNSTTSYHVGTSYSMSFGFAIKTFLFWISFNGCSMSFTVLQNPGSQPANFSEVYGNVKTPSLSGIISNVNILKLSATVGSTTGIDWSVIIGLDWKSFHAFLEYDSASTIFSGSLVSYNFYSTESDKLLP